MATWLYINNETVSPITWMTSRASVPGKCFTTDISSQNTSRGFCKHEYNIIFNNLHLRAKVNTHTPHSLELLVSTCCFAVVDQKHTWDVSGACHCCWRFSKMLHKAGLPRRASGWPGSRLFCNISRRKADKVFVWGKNKTENDDFFPRKRHFLLQKKITWWKVFWKRKGILFFFSKEIRDF